MDTFVPRKKEGGLKYETPPEVGSDDTVASVIYPKPKKGRRHQSLHQPPIVNVYDLESKHCLIVHIFFACMLQLLPGTVVCVHTIVLLVYQFTGSKLIEGMFPNVFTYGCAGILIVTAGVFSCLVHNVHHRFAPANAMTAVCLISGAMILLVSTVILSIILSTAREGPVKADLEQHLASHKDPDAFWDGLQTKGKCCGIHSKDDWVKNNFPIPLSCCENKIDNTCKKWFTRGCLNVQYRNDVSHHIHLIGASCIGLFVWLPALIIMVLAYWHTSKEQRLQQGTDYRLPSIKELYSQNQSFKNQVHIPRSNEMSSDTSSSATISKTNLHSDMPPPASTIIAIYQTESMMSLSRPGNEMQLKSKQTQPDDAGPKEGVPIPRKVFLNFKKSFNVIAKSGYSGSVFVSYREIKESQEQVNIKHNLKEERSMIFTELSSEVSSENVKGDGGTSYLTPETSKEMKNQVSQSSVNESAKTNKLADDKHDEYNK